MQGVKEGPRQLRHRGAERRRTLILEELFHSGHVSVSPLSELFNVSEMTIRRDLHQLARAGELELVHGGARIPEHQRDIVDFSARTLSNSTAKQSIAERAANLLAERSVIGIDAGTTAHSCAVALSEIYSGTIITNSIPVLSSLVDFPGVSVIGLGGDLLHRNKAMVGSRVTSALEQIRIETLLLGASAVTADGIYNHSSVELATKTALIAASAEVILVADSTKANASGAVRVCGWEKISSLVTEAPWPADLAQAISRKNITFVTP